MNTETNSESYSFLGDIFSVLECFTNRSKTPEDATELFSHFYSSSCALNKTDEQFREQIKRSTVILMHNFDEKEFSSLGVSECSNRNKAINLLTEWKTKVRENDKELYEKLIEFFKNADMYKLKQELEALGYDKRLRNPDIFELKYSQDEVDILVDILMECMKDLKNNKIKKEDYQKQEMQLRTAIWKFQKDNNNKKYCYRQSENEHSNKKKQLINLANELKNQGYPGELFQYLTSF